ncbi:DUF4309 domain-containing protein [Brevibacillus laterosporus]|uniref:YjgB family protein n=1 Tax=Brevibacillus laterosporus TaxID=1465 RepID=UPI00240531C4|nr:YjgB family protein [Brevibacillus laterosporus]MDF9412835.1 DUF4309 domain-containing protein [Brevibacillus laterosporus]
MSSNKFSNLDEQSNQTLKHLQTLPDHKLDATSKQHMLAHLLREEKKEVHRTDLSIYFTWISKGIVCSSLVLATFWLGNAWVQKEQPINSNKTLVSATISDYKESRNTDLHNTDPLNSLHDSKTSVEKNTQTVTPAQNKLLVNVMERARSGKVINADIAVKTSLADDIKKVWGESKGPDQVRFGLPTTNYPEKSLAFSYNKGEILVEIISTDTRLKDLNKEQVEQVLGKPQFVQQFTDQLKYSYPAGGDYQLVFYFTPISLNNSSNTTEPSARDHDVSPQIEHVSVVYPDGRKNLMLGDNIDFLQRMNESASKGLLVEDFVVGRTTKEQIEQRWGKADKTDTPYKTTYAIYRKHGTVVGYDSKGLLIEIRSFDLRLQDIHLSEVKTALGEKLKGYFNRNKEQIFTYPLNSEFQLQVVISPVTNKNTDPLVDHINVIHKQSESWET